MKTTPLKGMKDILPREQRIRDYVQGEILKSLASLESLRAQMQGDEQSRRALIEQYRAASEQSQREIGTHETEIAALSGKMTEKRAELERGELDGAAYADWKASF